MKKNILFYLLFFISILSFSQDDKTNKYNLESFFNAIKIFNNRYALSLIEPENLGNNDENNIKFGPRVEDVIVENKNNKNIDINYVDNNGYTALIICAEYGNDVILDKLLSMNVNLDVKHPVLGKTVLNTAIYFEKYNVAKKLIEYDKSLVNKSDDKDGFTPVMDAIVKGDADILKFLLEKGADPLIKDKKGYTALDLALKLSKGEMIKIIKDYLNNQKRR